MSPNSHNIFVFPHCILAIRIKKNYANEKPLVEA